ncbi:protein kinase [Streptomyces sp. NPDC059740]|uniref:serine/threonine-protein kinase n=1 Tax=Streptomyces sp. NPDC059740 TaxID=3346926 RepID=UPI003659D0D8
MAMMRLRREDPRVVGSFRLHRRLGAGGMGVVYLGSDKRGQRVALKVIRPDLAEDQEFRSRFAREVSAARRIRGGCTARLVAADLDADRPWFATQYVPGPSLHDRVTTDGPLPPAEVAGIGAALSEGLLAVHDAGVVHRDLKPSNILLSPKGPRIIDFGIAWATGASTLTHVGTAVGSPGFLAPEQVRGAAVTPATDIFSLGATLAYACTTDSPFGQGSSEIMLYRVVHEEPHLDGVPEALAPLLASCLAKDPADRPSTLSLSLRLKEIAAREAHGLPHVPPARPERYSAEHDVDAAGPPTVAAATPSGSGPRSAAPAAPRRERGEDGHHEQTGRRGGTRSGDRTGRPTGARNRSGRPAPRATEGRPPRGGAPTGPRGHGATEGRAGVPRPARQGARGGRPTGRAGARRPQGPDRRLLRQRLVVFVTVTLLVALGIAAAQGCQGPTRGLGHVDGVRVAPVAGAGSPTALAPGSAAPRQAVSEPTVSEPAVSEPVVSRAGGVSAGGVEGHG